MNSNGNSGDDNGFSRRELALLSQARDAGGAENVRLCTEQAARTIEGNRDAFSALSRADNPVVVDAPHSGIDHADAKDALEAIVRVDNAKVVEAERLDRLDAAESALREIVGRVRGLSDDTVDQMDAPALLSEIDEITTESAVNELTDLPQHPETGRGDRDADGDDGLRSVDDLDPEQRDRLEDLKRRHDVMADRTPDYAAELRGEMTDILGADSYDDVADDIEVL